MDRTIKVNPYSASSIDKAIDYLKRYKKAMTEFAMEYPAIVLDVLDTLLTTNAPASVNGEWTILDVSMNGNHAEGFVVFNGAVQFIEFGTGIIGEMNHGGINPEWLEKLPPPYNVGYNTGKKIIHVNKGLDYWWYHDGTKFVMTSGVPADPFIYRSVQQVLQAHKQLKEGFFKSRL